MPSTPSSNPRRKKAASTAASAKPRLAPAHAFAAVRRDHADEMAEDYVEAVATVIAREGQCRVKDLCQIFGVTHVTVIKTVARLVEKGLLWTEPHRPIELTGPGRTLARKVQHRHQIVLSFLLHLGISPETAQTDAEGIEHHISPETLERLAWFVTHTEAIQK